MDDGDQRSGESGLARFVAVVVFAEEGVEMESEGGESLLFGLFEWGNVRPGVVAELQP